MVIATAIGIILIIRETILISEFTLLSVNITRSSRLRQFMLSTEQVASYKWRVAGFGILVTLQRCTLQPATCHLSFRYPSKSYVKPELRLLYEITICQLLDERQLLFRYSGDAIQLAIH